MKKILFILFTSFLVFGCAPENNTENGKYQFLITGGLDTTDLNKLMNATLISVGLLNADNPQVNTIFVIPANIPN